MEMIKKEIVREYEQINRERRGIVSIIVILVSIIISIMILGITLYDSFSIMMTYIIISLGIILSLIMLFLWDYINRKFCRGKVLLRFISLPLVLTINYYIIEIIKLLTRIN